MLGTVDGTVLTAGAAEAEHERREAALQIALDMVVGKLVYGFQELQNLTVVLKETDYRLVQSRQLLIRLVAPRVVGAATVEDISAAIAALILRNSFAIREAVDMYDERTFAVILRICCRTVERIGFVDVAFGCLEAIGTLHYGVLLGCELWQFGKPAQHIHHVWIWEQRRIHLQKVAEVLYGWGY